MTLIVGAINRRCAACDAVNTSYALIRLPPYRASSRMRPIRAQLADSMRKIPRPKMWADTRPHLDPHGLLPRLWNSLTGNLHGGGDDSDPALRRIEGISGMGHHGVKAPQTGGTHHGQRAPMQVVFQYQASAGGNDAANRRIAMAAHREAAQTMFEIAARESRTGIRAAGAAIGSFGMSPFRL